VLSVAPALAPERDELVLRLKRQFLRLGNNIESSRWLLTRLHNSRSRLASRLFRNAMTPGGFNAIATKFENTEDSPKETTRKPGCEAWGKGAARLARRARDHKVGERLLQIAGRPLKGSQIIAQAEK